MHTTNSKIFHFRPWDKDRYMSPDIIAVNNLLKEDKIWNAVKHHMESYHTSQVKRTRNILIIFRILIPFDFHFVPQTCVFLSSSQSYIHYSKHWPYTVAYTIDCVWSNMLNHGLNHGFFFHFSSLYPAPYIELYVC